MNCEALVESLVNLAPEERIKYSFSKNRTAYFVTSLGRIFSLTPKESKLQLGTRGYYEKRTMGKNVTVHRLVANAFIPNPENKPEVNHIDGRKTNNNVTNLEWVSRKENNNHAIRAGLTTPPKKNHNAKFSEEAVNRVVNLVKSGWTYKAAGATEGMSYSTVAHLMTGRRRTPNLKGYTPRGLGFANKGKAWGNAIRGKK